MGTSVGVEQFLGKLEAYTALVETSDLEAVKLAAVASKSTINTFLARDTKGHMRLSGVGKRGAAIGTVYALVEGVNPTAILTPYGPEWLLEDDTKAHEIVPKRLQLTAKGNRRRTGSNALHFDGRFASHVESPGTTGKHPFAAGSEAAIPVASQAFRQVHEAALRKVFA